MKKLMMIVAVAGLVSGCSWIGHRDGEGVVSGEGGIPGADLSPGRGTTGVSSGADGGGGITGSDAVVH
jgi:hypothetical protein